MEDTISVKKLGRISIRFQKDVPHPSPLNNAPNKSFAILSGNSEFLSNPETPSSKMKILLPHQPQKIILLFPGLLPHEIYSHMWYVGMLEYILHEILSFLDQV